jgi:transcriptional regulator with XRE-family HTH domain
MDQKIIKNIYRYIYKNDISISRLANEAGMSYHRLWAILNQSYTIKVGDYVALCRALKEPLDFFIPK